MLSTTGYRRGDIVLVPFPFTDLTSATRRPALVVSPDAFNERMQDVVLATVPSHLTDTANAVAIDDADFADGRLPKKSVLKLGKLFTIHSSLVVKRVGILRSEKVDEVLGTIRQFFS